MPNHDVDCQVQRQRQRGNKSAMRSCMCILPAHEVSGRLCYDREKGHKGVGTFL
jgi:hypothetical protein